MSPAAPRLLRLPDVLGRVGISRSSIYDLVQRGAFPQPVKLGTRCTAWVEGEIDGWVRARIAERVAPEATQP
ncbi:MAG: AlpA family transcriptional regulator [Polyangia bacterium]